MSDLRLHRPAKTTGATTAVGAEVAGASAALGGSIPPRWCCAPLRSLLREPLEAAKAAATEFTRTVTDAGVDVGVVTFADEARLVQAPTGDVDAIVDAIAGVEADGETALFDAVLVGARTLQNLSGTRSMVVFSDGADTVENTGLEAAVTAAQTAEASVSTVALETGELDIAALERLADSTGGRLVQAANTQQLGDRLQG